MRFGRHCGCKDVVRNSHVSSGAEGPGQGADGDPGTLAETAGHPYSRDKLSRFPEESKAVELFLSVNLVGLLKDQMPSQQAASPSVGNIKGKQRPQRWSRQEMMEAQVRAEAEEEGGVMSF